MMVIHQTPNDPRKWDAFFLDEDEFETEKQRVTKGSNGILFLPNYEYDEDDNIHIEDYSDMDNYHRAQKIEKWMDYAASVASKSICQKSQRGAVVVRDNNKLGEACSGPTSGKVCQPCRRMQIHNNTQFDQCNGVHAEGTAAENARGNHGDLEDSTLYYVKTRDGKIIPSGDYACTECSGIILDSGIKEVVLWHGDTHLKNGQITTAHFVIYSASKLHELARQYAK